MPIKEVATYLYNNNKYQFNNNTSIPEIESILRDYIKLAYVWKSFYNGRDPKDAQQPLTDKWHRALYLKRKGITDTDLKQQIIAGKVDMVERNKIWADISMLMEYAKTTRPDFVPYWKPYSNIQQILAEGLITSGEISNKLKKEAGITSSGFRISPLMIGAAAIIIFMVIKK